MMKKRTKTDSSYVMVFKHNNETCSLPPPPKMQPVRKSIAFLLKLFRLYTGL